MTTPSRLTIYNNSGAALQLGLEPEGDCVTVPVGSTCVVQGDASDAEFEVEIEDDLVSIYLDAGKHVEIDGAKVR